MEKVDIKKIFDKTATLLKTRQRIGGLEISDSILRFVRWNGSGWDMYSLKLVPGIVVKGEIKNTKEFTAALKLLKKKINASDRKNKDRIHAIVSLSSIGIYTQTFNLPFIEGENLEKAIQLNIQMASPTDTSASYAGWQFVDGEDNEVKLEILSAFLDRKIVDEVSETLEDAGFLAVAIESRALSLARVVRTMYSGFEPEKSIVLVSVDGSGIDVLIARKGNLYFDYFTSWQDLQGNSRKITLSAFKTMVLRSVNQVINFYNSHWKGSLDEILVLSSGMQEEVIKVIRSNFDVPTKELAFNMSPPIHPDWSVALGGAIRGRIPRRSDREISLLGIDTQEKFRRDQLISFLHFWRLTLPASLLLLLVFFSGVLLLLARIDSSVTKDQALNLGPKEQAEIVELENKTKEFNKLVGYVDHVNKTAEKKSEILSVLSSILQENNIVVRSISILSLAEGISLSGSAESQEDIINLKNDLEISESFTNVNLPITNIQGTDGGYLFSMTFQAASIEE